MNELLDPLVKRVERPYDIPFNVAVWISFKPIIKIYLSIGAGFFLAKKNILTPQLSKGISRLVLLLFLPALIFNNIVSQIKDTDIKIFGVIIFSGFIYYTIGLGWGFVVRMLTPIPRAWFGGLLLCCMLNNCSDLTLAYIQTIGNSPLLPSDVAVRGVSYCVLIVIVFTIFNFNLGGTRLVEWDATRKDPKREEPTVPIISWTAIKSAYRKLRHGKLKLKLKKKSDDDPKSGHSSTSDTDDTMKDLEAQNHNSQNDSSQHEEEEEEHVPYSENDHMQYLSRSITAQSQARARQERHMGSTDVYYATTPGGSIISTSGYEDARSAFTIDPNDPVAYQNMARNMARAQPPDKSKEKANKNQDAKADSHWQKFKKKWFKFKHKNFATKYICNFFEDVFLPPALALILGIAVCMIPWVRRVFVEGQHIAHFHDAPDHMPPLSFLMDFFKFISGAQVPLGLLLLGGTIASLKVGKMVKGFWKSLILIVIFKLAILPIIACAWIHRIREIGWVSKDDPIVPIVLAVSSATPTATVQVYLTLSWMDPTKESVELNCLAMALMAQYLLLPITLPFLMTYVVMHFV